MIIFQAKRNPVELDVYIPNGCLIMKGVASVVPRFNIQSMPELSEISYFQHATVAAFWDYVCGLLRTSLSCWSVTYESWTSCRVAMESSKRCEFHEILVLKKGLKRFRRCTENTVDWTFHASVKRSVTSQCTSLSCFAILLAKISRQARWAQNCGCSPHSYLWRNDQPDPSWANGVASQCGRLDLRRLLKPYTGSLSSQRSARSMHIVIWTN